MPRFAISSEEEGGEGRSQGAWPDASATDHRSSVSAASRKSPGLLAPRGPRGEELPLAIPELPLERELKLEESPTTPGSAPSQPGKATPTGQSQMRETGLTIFGAHVCLRLLSGEPC